MSTSEAETCLDVARSVVAIGRTLRRRSTAESSTLTLLGVLQAVSQHGGARSSALAEYMNTDLSVVSRRLAALQADGLVERVADPADGRAHLVALTASGHERLAALRAAAGESIAAALPDWSAADLRALAGLLQRFEHDLSGFGTTPSSTDPAPAGFPAPSAVLAQR